MIELLKREVTTVAERKIRQAILLGRNSANVTIPADYARRLNIKPGTNLVIELVGDKLVISNLDSELDSKPKVEIKP